MVEYHTPDELLTRSTLWKIIKSFVPNEYLETVDDAKFSSMEFTKNEQEELVQYVLDNSNEKMRMYGNAKELTEQLNSFRTFPMCHKFFECERSEPYNYDLRIYIDNNEKSYISKDSVFIYIQSFIQKNLPFTNLPHSSLILTLFLKIQEEKLKNSLEFITCDDEFDNYMVSELEATMEALMEEVIASQDHPKYSLDDYINLFTKLLPESCTAKEIASLREYVIDFYNKQSDGSSNDPEPLFTSYIEIKHSFNYVKRLSEKKPHLFSRWIDLPPEMNFKVPAIARLFKDRSGYFFIEAELEEALKMYQTGHAQPSRTIEGNFLHTIDADAANNKYETDLGKMTILQYDIPLKFSEFTPIPSNFGVFVVSGLQAFHRLFRRIIFVHKVFQKLKNYNMQPFNRYIEIIDEVLDLRGTRQYLLKYDVFHRLEKMTADFWNKVLPQPAKDVRDVKSDGFTMQDLKNELVYLGLTKAFPNIAKFSKQGYNMFLKVKPDNCLRTCDLFNAIEYCQLTCVVLRYPILADFFKIQRGQLPRTRAEMLSKRIPLLDRITSDPLIEIKQEDVYEEYFPAFIDNETIKSLTNCNKEMKKKMDKLEADKLRTIEANNKLNNMIVDLKAEIQSAEENLHTAESRLENEVSQRNQEMKRLQDENSQLKIQKQQMERMIQELTAPGTSSSEVSKENQSKIEEHRRWKKYSCEQLRKARKMADKLATTTSNEVTRQMAVYEISQFEFQVRTYVETIDMNIQKMEAFNIFAVVSIPTNYPSFSQKFLEEYWKLPKEETRNGLEDDMECLICHDDMRKGEENLLKCHECSRFYHIQCAVGWIQKKHCCAVCKYTLVDPNELPYYD